MEKRVNAERILHIISAVYLLRYRRLPVVRHGVERIPVAMVIVEIVVIVRP